LSLAIRGFGGTSKDLGYSNLHQLPFGGKATDGALKFGSRSFAEVAIVDFWSH